MLVFFFKQKTAYEMRISDWSSDVCSSDLDPGDARGREDVALGRVAAADRSEGLWRHGDAAAGDRAAQRRGLGADIDHMRGAGCVEMSRFECHARGAKQGGARKARGDGGERPRRAEPSRWVSRLRSTRTAEEYGRKRPIADIDPPCREAMGR